MAKKISLDPEGDDFILRLGTAKIVLSAENVLDLCQSALSHRQYIMSRLHPGSVYATPVARMNAMWDALEENILLEMQFAPSGNVIFEAVPDSSKGFAEKMLDLLARKQSSQLSRH